MSKIVNLADYKKKQTRSDQPQDANMTPNFDPEAFFRGVMEQNKRAKKAAEKARERHNKTTKRRYNIKDKD